MGLDMYLFKVEGKYSSEELLKIEVYEKLEEKLEEVGYLRKHADLNAYMTDLYISRGGNEEFNCIPLPLSKGDLIDLRELTKEALEDEEVFETGQGFFWGETCKEHHIKTLDILEKILKNTDFKKETIIYECWY